MTVSIKPTLVSSPNENGGLFLIEGNTARLLDRVPTTGLNLTDGYLCRGIQPNVVTLTMPDASTFLENESLKDIHDILITQDAIYAVGTDQNSIIQHTLAGELIRAWKFPGEPDSWHINCLAQWGDDIVFSAFCDQETHRAYKEAPKNAGFVQSVLSGKRLVEGLSQPHSPTPYGENLLLANSACYQILEIDPSGKIVRSQSFEGYTRGISVQEDVILIGLSRSRNTDNIVIPTAQVIVLDKQTWAEIDRIELPSNEIYDIRSIPEQAKGDRLLYSIAFVTLKVVTNRLESTTIALKDARREIKVLKKANATIALKDARREIKNLKSELKDVKSSTSWKITAPIRNIRLGKNRKQKLS